ncbi:MAG: response regulator transcription factor [Bacteroidales bacterium]|nr:response regulator transcription factor [Bacteroidales bacterium]
MNESRILVVDDEPDLREILQFNLEQAGYQVDTAESAEAALQVLTPQHALLLLDVMMGGMSGFQLAELLRRQHNDIPIIFLTAKDTESDLLRGFQTGADDYIAKPFSLHEVLARVKAVLHRQERIPVPEKQEEKLVQTIHSGGILADLLRKVVLVNGEEVRLSPKELGILCLLLRHPGRVFSREEILAQVWRGESYVLDRTVDVHIARIRRKLGNEGMRLTNRQGYGYCLEA